MLLKNVSFVVSGPMRGSIQRDRKIQQMPGVLSAYGFVANIVTTIPHARHGNETLKKDDGFVLIEDLFIKDTPENRWLGAMLAASNRLAMELDIDWDKECVVVKLFFHRKFSKTFEISVLFYLKNDDSSIMLHTDEFKKR